MRDDCLRLAVHPRDAEGSLLADGARLDQGVFYRNQEKAKNRFGLTPPEFGYTLDPAAHNWNWYEDEERSGLSVNLVACVRTRRCSVALHHTPQRFRWVVRIHLEKLSEATAISLIAKYRPIEVDTEKNPCHFELLPSSDSIDETVIRLKSTLKKLLDIKMTKDSVQNADQQKKVEWLESFLRVENIEAEEEASTTDIAVGGT